MENDYLKRLETLEKYLNCLSKLEEIKRVLTDEFQKNINDCQHELLLTFGEIQDTRVYGSYVKYYCPFCGKLVIHYLSDDLDQFYQKHQIIDLKSVLEKYQNKEEIIIIIRELINDYIKLNQKSSIQDIYDYINSIVVLELLPKTKKYDLK